MDKELIEKAAEEAETSVEVIEGYFKFHKDSLPEDFESARIALKRIHSWKTMGRSDLQITTQLNELANIATGKIDPVALKKARKAVEAGKKRRGKPRKRATKKLSKAEQERERLEDLYCINFAVDKPKE